MQVSAEMRIEAPAEDVWSAVKRFDGVTRWAPGVLECTANGEGVGAVRTLKMRDGMTLCERLETYDDQTRSFSYSIVEGPLPVKDYLSCVSVSDDGDQCTVSWTTSGEPAGISGEQLEKILGSVCHGSVKALKTHCELQATTEVRKLDSRNS